MSIGCFLYFFTLFLFESSAWGIDGELIILRDTQTESLIRTYVEPIFAAAALPKKSIEVVLVKDKSFNAFTTGRSIFINTGALIAAETPNQLIGVLAHETGHLAGGHLQRLHIEAERTNKIMIASLLLGAGALIVGKNDSLAQAGAGIGVGMGELGQRGFLNYRRSEETTADHSALHYLNATRQSAKGFLQSLKKFHTDFSLSGSVVNSYLSTHPMPQDRIENLERKAKASAFFNNKDSAALQRRHDTMRMKMAFYTQGQESANRIKQKISDPYVIDYADALNSFLFGHNIKKALEKINKLINKSPNDPYLYELKGDALMKARDPNEAASAYRKAVSLDYSGSSLLKTSWGGALLEKGNPQSIKKAINVLKSAIARDKKDYSTYGFLGRAFTAIGDLAHANLAAANEFYYRGDLKKAESFALRAMSGLKKDSKDWLEAKDILQQKKDSKRKK